ncbi:lycopene cyclase domain-containing protein [Curtobacterium sp. 1P10AnD]|uniref:lycopene cyclase domain-containing protein n=1 Tax=Curtobacterium sp. 1P10AnD TaxID=3132283 RepID=UPI0039A25304
MSSHAAYALLAVPFLAVAVVVAVVAGLVAARRARTAGRPSAPGRRVTLVSGVIAGVALLVMTMVFDNVIVTLRVVAYDPSLISGAKIGAIPIEDLAYSIGAVLLLPALWVLLDRPSTAPPAHPTRSPSPEHPTRDAHGARPSAEGEPTP